MTPLFITGSPAHVQPLLDHLHASGLQPALPLPRDARITLANWHQRVLADHSGARGPVAPGRMWEQLAIDLFLANIDQPQWAWGHPDSLALLDRATRPISGQ